MNLSDFITAHIEQILDQWDAFAVTQRPAAMEMSSKELRNHARQILEVVAADLKTTQSASDQQKKSKGDFMDSPAGAIPSAASTHGMLREASGFTLLQLTAEYRAVRASVLRLWHAHSGTATSSAVEDLMRFNEAIDQALAESVVKYSQHAARTRDTFLAVLGNDLRGPLASVAEAGDYLTQPNPRPVEIQRIGARLKRNAAAMNALTSDLLEYAQTQLGGKLQIDRQPVSLKQVAEAALHDASAAFPDCPYDLEVDGDSSGSFDGVRVRQLLANLLSNAAQYRDKHYRVTLGLLGEAQEVVLYVKNRGATIPEALLEAVFNPLVQLDLAPDQNRPSTSLGLGLFVAREISKAHGGTIEAVSSENDGTVFTVRLPREG